MKFHPVMLRAVSIFVATYLLASSVATGVFAAAADFQAFADRQWRKPVAEFSTPPTIAKAPFAKFRTNRYNGWWTRAMLEDYRLFKARRAAESGDLLACTALLQGNGGGGENPGGGPGSGSGDPPSGSGGSGGSGGGGPWGGGGPGIGGGGASGQSNPATGDLLMTVPLTGWPCKGAVGVNLTLFHNSFNNSDGPLGHGWTTSFDMEVNQVGSTAILSLPNGTEAPYTWNATTSKWDRPKGFMFNLEKHTNGSWTLTTKHLGHYEFNTNGKVVEIADRFNNKVTIVRDSNQLVTEVYGDDDAASRRKLTFTYNSGKLNEIQVINGNNQTFYFTVGSGVLEEIDFASGNQTGIYRTFNYDSNWNITSEDDWDEHYFGWTYDSNDRITQSEDSNEKTHTYSYGTNSSGQQTVSIWNPLGKHIDYVYDDFLLMQRTDECGYSTQFQYDADRNRSQIKVLHSGGSNPVWRTTNLTYDGTGNLTSYVDPEGNETTLTWRTSDNLIDYIESEAPSSRHLDFEYDNYGRLWKLKRTDGTVVQTLNYNAAGEATDVWDALNRHTHFVYDTNNYGDVAELDLPAELDSNGNPINPVVATFTYVLGRVATTSLNGNQKVHNYFDYWLRVNESHNANNKSWEALYDSRGQISYFKDERGTERFWIYDAVGNLIQFKDGLNRNTYYDYDDAYNVTGVTNPRGYTTTLEYTDRGEVKKITTPQTATSNIVEEWTYTPAGEIARHITPLTDTSFTYDKRGLLTKVDYPSQTDTVLTYDELGRLAEMTDATGTTEWSFDSNGLTASMSGPQGEVQYEYSVAGELTKLKDMGAGGSHQDISYEYGAATGRLRKLASQDNEVTWFDYDSDGRLWKKRLPTGLDEVFDYDSVDRIYSTSIKNHTSGQTLHSQTYTYDDASRVTGLSEYDSAANTTSGTTYGYDNADRLTSESRAGYSVAYTFDANDNRLTKAVTGGSMEVYTYDRGDKLTDVSINGSTTKSFAYDSDGRLASQTVGSNTTTYSWDQDSRLASIDLPGTSNDATYTYDGYGTRVAQIVGSTSSNWKRAGPGVTAPVVADSGASYVPGLSERRSGTTHYAHSGLKNEFAQSTGTSLSATRTYDAYGATTASTGTWTGGFGYAGAYGYQEDSNSGLKLLGNRYYDSSLGRFISRDPAKDGSNWYAYCAGNPISRFDDGGLLWREIGGLVGGIAGAALGPLGSVGGAGLGSFLGSLADGDDCMSAAGNGLTDAALEVATLGVSEGIKALRAARSISRVLEAGAEESAALSKVVSTPTKGGIYVLMDGDVVKYAGKTNDFKRRAAEHFKNFPELDFFQYSYTDNPTAQRLLEQKLIEEHGGIGGGQLLNKVNSISKKNPLYQFVHQ